MSAATPRMSTKEAREKFSDLVNRTAFAKERVVVTRNKRQMAAMVPVEDLELLELLEDYVDLREAKKALAEARKQGIRSWAEVKAELGL
jgi:prevent-host-death family protein